MAVRFLVAAWVLLLAAPAAAQWQPLDSGGGFGSTPSAPASDPTSTMPPSAPGSGGYSSGIQGWSSGPGDGSNPAQLPATAPTPGMPSASGGGCGDACGGSPTTAPSPGPAAGPAIEITYQGQAAADPRTATMRLKIAGNQVTAHVKMQSICRQNVRVGGADIDLTGGLSGLWESEQASIDGSWTGVDHHCGTDDPNQGQFKFFLKDIGMGKKVLHLRITGKNGRYGWNFTPKNKVFTPSGDGGAGAPAFVGTAGGFDSPLGPPRQGFTTGARPPAFAAAASYGDRLRQLFTRGTITLQVGDSVMRNLPSAENMGAGYDADFNRVSARPSCVTTQNSSFVVEPGGLADAVRVGNAVRVTARSPGKGELWMQTMVRCREPSGATSQAKVLAIHIVLVGDQAIQDYRDPSPSAGTPPPVTPGDIDQAVVRGYARMVETGEPVAGAMVTLITPEGGSIGDPSWKTGGDGSFRIMTRPSHNLRSGRYSVMVQKLGMPEVPGRCTMRAGTPPGIGVDCDLWPVREVYVSLSRDNPDADAGMIDMNYLRFIPSRGGEAKASGAAPLPAAQPAPKASRFR